MWTSSKKISELGEKPEVYIVDTLYTPHFPSSESPNPVMKCWNNDMFYINRLVEVNPFIDLFKAQRFLEFEHTKVETRRYATLKCNLPVIMTENVVHATFRSDNIDLKDIFKHQKFSQFLQSTPGTYFCRVSTRVRIPPVPAEIFPRGKTLTGIPP